MSVPAAGMFTVRDLADTPEDGRRWELIEGAFVVSPQSRYSHSLAASRLAQLLREHAPAGVEVISEISLQIDATTHLVPDLTALSSEGIDPAELGVPSDRALVVVEVESPSSRRRDRVEKPRILARAGIPHFWRVETDGVPTVVVSALVDGAYVEVARATGDELLTVTEPFPVRVTPAELFR